MNFREAERRFGELKRQYETGVIGPAEFDDRRERLEVRDRDGLRWTIGREGVWYYHDGSGWERGTPPVLPARSSAPWAGLGALCAAVSLLLISLLVYMNFALLSPPLSLVYDELQLPMIILSHILGGLGFFFGRSAKRRGNRAGGIAVMVSSGVCLVLGLLLWALVLWITLIVTFDPYYE